ncbi:multiheme c-type cytochrome [Hydrogenimonas sp.]
MKKLLLFLISTLTLFSAEYLTNKSCRECHPDIYDEFRTSWHAKGYFNDTLHKKVADKIPVYDCGRCHMPAATNLKELEAGKTRPNPIRQEQKDAVSCFYCHQIAYVKEAHKFNEIVPARQAAGYKPSLYGSLENPDDNDKHASVKSPIYRKYACLGCHGHKRNGHDVMVFEAMKPGQGSEKCIECHMPDEPGPPEKMNKRARNRHHSHHFYGIHDAAMRKKAVKLVIEPKKDEIDVTIENRMGHPLVIHPARMKYLKLQVVRDGKVIWQNFKKEPCEDRQGCFTVDFEDGDGKPVGIPYFAKKRGFVNNLEAKKSKTLRYRVPTLQKNDRIIAQMEVILAKPSCAAAAGITDETLTKPLEMVKVEKVVE